LGQGAIVKKFLIALINGSCVWIPWITFKNAKTVISCIRSKQAATCVLKAPKKEGRYRLFLNVSDGEKIAYCNFPFYVQPSEAAEDQPMVRFKKTTLSSFENE
jgi:hypothetical protein